MDEALLHSTMCMYLVCIGSATFVVLFTGKFLLLHLYMHLERLFMSTYIVFSTEYRVLVSDTIPN